MRIISDQFNVIFHNFKRRIVYCIQNNKQQFSKSYKNFYFKHNKILMLDNFKKNHNYLQH